MASTVDAYHRAVKVTENQLNSTVFNRKHDALITGLLRWQRL